MTLVPGKIHQSSEPSTPGPLTKVAIVGRGFTGVMSAIALLKTFNRPFHLVLYDPYPKIDGGEGVGRPGGTVLNSRVRDLSVDPLARNDFRRWLETDGAGRERGASEDNVDHAFVPGEVFSAYVYQRFSEALRERTDVMVQVRAESVTSIGRHAKGGIAVSTSDGERTLFDSVYLATGYGLRDPSEGEVGPSAVRETIVIGGGIYAVDRALRLLSSGETAHVTLISASGFLPQPHTVSAIGVVTPARPFPHTLRGAFRYLREAANTASAEGSGWQGIMNDFRLHASDLWKGLSPEERRRFKRHVKPIYDSHRNRLPPAQYERLKVAIRSGAITVKKGKVERIATNGVLLSSGGELQILPSDRTLNCRIRPTDIDSPLLRSVLSADLAIRDELDLGLFVDGSGRALTADGFAGVFALGPLGLGSLPDIDLVPEIVVQSYSAASALGAWVAVKTAVDGASD